MAREIERKFLVRNDGWRGRAVKSTPYRQGYLSMDPDRSVRIRVAGEKGALTVKGRSQGSARDEFEYEIPRQDAEQMLRICVQPLIEKTRHIVPAGELKWEVDEFEGANHGLVLAELEIPEEGTPLTNADWLGKEVTGDPRYFNLSLVKNPYSEWVLSPENGSGKDN